MSPRRTKRRKLSKDKGISEPVHLETDVPEMTLVQVKTEPPDYSDADTANVGTIVNGVASIKTEPAEDDGDSLGFPTINAPVDDTTVKKDPDSPVRVKVEGGSYANPNWHFDDIDGEDEEEEEPDELIYSRNTSDRQPEKEQGEVDLNEMTSESESETESEEEETTCYDAPDTVTLETMGEPPVLRELRKTTTPRPVWVGNPVDDPEPSDVLPSSNTSQKDDTSDPDFSADSATNSESSSECSCSDDEEIRELRRKNKLKRALYQLESSKTISSLVTGQENVQMTEDDSDALKFTPLMSTVKICNACPDPLIIIRAKEPGQLKLNYQCKLCCAQFHCNHHLKIHTDIHQFDNACAVCGNKFPSAHNEDIHFRFKHLPRNERYCCRICDTDYQTEKDYNAHWKSCYDSKQGIKKESPRVKAPPAKRKGRKKAK